MSLCLITPRLPPAIDGLGNYCRQLWHHCCFSPLVAPGVENAIPADHLATINDTPWKFLVLDGAEESARIWSQVDIHEFTPSKDALTAQLRKLNPHTVILQYVGYGFDHNGSPLWLAAALEEWKREMTDGKIIVMFHETWSSGKPWQKVFWQTRTQQKCVKRVLDVASCAVTSTRANAISLEILGSATPVQIIPIGSGFVAQPSQHKNWKQLLVFGKEPSRQGALKTHKRLIQDLVANKIIDRIVLAGQSTSTSFDEGTYLKNTLGADVEIITCFNYDSKATPDPVRTCGLALMHTQSTHLLKSTAFQLAVQLEQTAICLSERPADPPLAAGKHYLMYEPDNIQPLLEALRNKSTLLDISSSCAKLNTELLSWSRIAAMWCRLITN